MRGRTDSADIKRELTDRLESLLDSYYPGWVYGQAKRSAFLAPRGKGDLGSFEVYLSGAQRGEWFRRSQGIGGDPINLLAYAITGDHKAYRDAFREAAVFLGLAEGTPRQRPAEAKQEAPPDESREARRADAFRLWKAARPLIGSPAEQYLRGRGIRFALDEYMRLRYHPAARYDHPDSYREGLRFGALLAAVQGPDMRFRGVWRIFLQDGNKAPVKAPKLGMGPCRGGAVWLGEPGPHVNVCEGLETGFGVRGLSCAVPPVACTLSTSGMRGWEPPPFVKSVHVYPDGDRMRLRATEKGERELPSPGLSAAEALRERLTAAGIACTVQPTPPSDKDYLDIWCELEALRERETVI